MAKRSQPGPSCRGVLAGLPHTTGLGFQTGHPTVSGPGTYFKIFDKLGCTTCLQVFRDAMRQIGPLGVHQFFGSTKMSISQISGPGPCNRLDQTTATSDLWT